MISLRNVTKTYVLGEEITITPVRDITLEVAKGEFVMIIGRSGSGKSTLLNLAAGLIRPTKGQVLIDNIDVSNMSDRDISALRSQKIGFIFQAFNLLPRTTALKKVTLPMIYAGIPKVERLEKAKKFLEMVGLGNRLFHTSNQLSGGQQQRVAIARSLVMNSAILLADEPTGNIASTQAEEIMAIFQKLNNDKHTIIMITHERDIAEHAKRIIHIRDGKIVADEINF